ncbi:MAG: porin family protein [Saprospiraceae bacterium]
MRFSTLCLLLIIGLILPTSVDAQRTKKKKKLPLFGASVFAGVNTSQLDGDEYTGFNKSGAYAGIRGVTRFTNRLQLNIELIYSQAGALFEHSNRPFAGPVKRDRLIKLDYAVAPILFRVYVDDEKDGTGVNIEVGAAYARLVNREVEEIIYDERTDRSYAEIQDDFNTSEWNFITGLGYDFNHKMGVNLRYTLGATRIYVNEDYMPRTNFSPREEDIELLRSYYISVMGMYHF